MIGPGDEVDHDSFGVGRVLSLLDSIATVEFFGEKIDVNVEELLPRVTSQSPVVAADSERPVGGLEFRFSFEAMNLGVVPTNPDQLVKLTIGGDQISQKIRNTLRDSPSQGACRVFMGYYGSGKSHHLKLVKAVALREGWVTASIEMDPKAADPAKPFTVYQELMAGLEFPMRGDGSRNIDFFDFIREIRKGWMEVRSLKYLKSSEWFSKGLEALQFLAHRRDDEEYVSAVNCLSGQVKSMSVINKVTRREGFRGKVPNMPKTKDTGLIYAFHLTVLNEIVRGLGYRGLAVIIDEAEHVRSYSVNRYWRANNFFDCLSRCAHAPRSDLPNPVCDYEILGVPPFWKEGPHFSLFVGLTEGEDYQDLEEKSSDMRVFFHSPEDLVYIESPSPAEYGEWVGKYLEEASVHLGPNVDMLSNSNFRDKLVEILRRRFENTHMPDRLLRNWIKLAGLAPAVLLSKDGKISENGLLKAIDDAAQQISGEVLPWDDY